jgi:hypothetical protein
MSDYYNTNYIVKDPDAVLDYVFNWATWLAGISDTISSHTVTVPAGITLGSSSIVGSTVVAWISGGTAATTYQVTCHIVTAAGREDDRSIYIVIGER